MPFDALTMAAVSDEVRDAVIGGQIQKILQPSQHAIGLSIYSGGRQYWLVLSADARHARVQLSPIKLAKAFPTPSSFVMLLRKHLEGRRVLDVVQPPLERMLILSCPGEDGSLRLIAEVMGKHSNIILVGSTDRVLGAVKIVPPAKSRVRPILPGREYTPPPFHGRDESLYPPGPRLDPRSDSAELLSLLSILPEGTPIGKALHGLLPGAGPFLIDQIALGAGTFAKAPLSPGNLPELLESAHHLYAFLDSRNWEPCVYPSKKGLDFTAFVPLGADDVQRQPTISHAIDLCLSATESRDILATVRRSAITTVEREQTAVQGRIASLREGLESAQSADTLKEAGQLVLAYQHLAEPGSTSLSIPDLECEIALDPRKTVQENAERMFRRYTKLRDAAKRIPRLLQAAEAEAARLAELRVFVDLAETESDLLELGAQARQEHQAIPTSARKKSRRQGPPRYALQGYTAIVGRSAKENEEVTFRLSGRDDLWLHARERTGAHVILQAGGNPPDEIVAAAASLAAYFSEARADTRVDVEVASVRDVRKIPNGPPGRVTYRNARTIRVAPSREGWASVR